MSKEDAQDSEFHLFFGRIEETINCFRDLLTFILKADDYRILQEWDVSCDKNPNQKSIEL